MIEEFRKFIGEHKLLGESDRILLAVSGGIDSMVMAQLFLSIGTNIGIAHCNFNLRGKESDKDEAFVKHFASENHIPFFTERFDTTGFATEKGISIQMAARELRYRWFEEIRHQNNFSLISIAHNLNDNVETFLINLTRGTGIAGLTGMKPIYKNIIRPLLFASRDAIIEYSNKNKVEYREDKSNAETKYTRNKIRHIIIPQFRSVNPSFETTITETAERLHEINEILTSHISEIREKVSFKRDNTIVFKLNALHGLMPKNTLIFELFKPFGISTGQMDDLLKLFVSRTGSQLFTSDYRLIKNRKELLVLKYENDSEDQFLINRLQDFRKFPECISAGIKKVNADFRIPDTSNIACLDAEKISYPMVFRKWKHGDSFYPLGMNQKKKLSDYFVDNKYSISDKEHCWILESDGKILWVANDRIDNRFKITRRTKKALIIEVKKSDHKN
jgi:tRNA(Ile)-lysidine synthase